MKHTRGNQVQEQNDGSQRRGEHGTRRIVTANGVLSAERACSKGTTRSTEPWAQTPAQPLTTGVRHWGSHLDGALLHTWLHAAFVHAASPHTPERCIALRYGGHDGTRPQGSPSSVRLLWDPLVRGVTEDVSLFGVCLRKRASESGRVSAAQKQLSELVTETKSPFTKTGKGRGETLGRRRRTGGK